ncbi:MAG: hypothetical protein AB1604_03555 [Euryarchaeota archaeon]
MIEISKDQKLNVLDSEVSDNIIHVFSRRIKDKNLSVKELNRKVDKEKLEDIVSKLMRQGKERDFEDIELEDNPHEFLFDIFNCMDKNEESFTNHVKYLLNDFTSQMKTRRREDDRYAVCIVANDYVLLANTVFGEETITPSHEIIPRMMDKDTVMLYVLFRKDKHDKIKVRYYEFYPSLFFMDWLGLPQKDSHFYQGGKYRLYTDILGNTTVLELTEDDIEALRDNIVNNQIVLEKSLEIINIDQIRIGKNRYGEFSEFFEKFMDERYDLKYYHNKFIELANNLNTQICKYRDCNDGVEKFQDETYKVEIKKRNPNFNILFGAETGNANIEFRSEYIDVLSSQYSNGVSFKVFHAGDKFSQDPIRIQEMDIFNELSCNFSKLLIDYINDTNFRDRDIFYMLSFTIFKILYHENKEKHVSTFFNLMASRCISMLQNKRITDNEDQILEYKSSDYFREGEDQDVANNIIEDIRKKLSGSELKVYLFGIVEPPKGKMDTIPQQQLSSDRLKSIENIILKEKYVNKINISPIEVDRDNCIVVLTVLGEKISKKGLFNMMK